MGKIEGGSSAYRKGGASQDDPGQEDGQEDRHERDYDFGLLGDGYLLEAVRSQDETPFIRIDPNITTGSNDWHFQY